LSLCEKRNIALNPNRKGYPHPLDSDRGWGGGSDKWEIVDGKRDYPEWYHGLAFTGGHHSYVESCGERQATINFGEPKTFDKVIIWHHGHGGIPKECKLQYWDDSNWIDIDFYREVDLEYRSGGAGATPDILKFMPVTSSKVRYAFNNCGKNILDEPNVHGWMYEFEVYEATPASKLIANLPIENIEGIGKEYGERLRRLGIEKIVHLAIRSMKSIPISAQQVDVPLFQLFTAKIRTELALSVCIDPIFTSIEDRTIEEIMEASYEELCSQTHQSIDTISALKREISKLLCALDNRIIKPMPLRNVFMWETAARGKVIINPMEVEGASLTYGTQIPSIASDLRRNLHVFWNDRLNSRDIIYHSTLDQNGNMLTGPLSLPKLACEDYSHSRNPAVVLDNDGNLQIIWWNLHQESGEWKSSICYSKLDKNSNILIAPRSLEINGIEKCQCYPSIAKDNDGNLQIFVGTTVNGKTSILYTKIDKNGKKLLDSFKKIETLFGYDPTVTVDEDDNVHLLWTEYDNGIIWYAKLDKNGNYIINPTSKLKPKPEECSGFQQPSIAAGIDGNLHLICRGYKDEKSSDLWYAKLNKNGNILIESVLKLDSGTSDSWPTIAIDFKGNIHVIWVASNMLWYAKIAP